MCINCIESICQNNCVPIQQEVNAKSNSPVTSNEESKGYYAVLWHYEGQSPALFTCRAESIDEADFLFHSEMIDHTSNHVLEIHIVSVEELKPEQLISPIASDEKPEGYYAVLWHYEGQSPALFTCRAESKDEAQFLFHAEMIDHVSNHVLEFHIDSIEQLELELTN